MNATFVFGILLWVSAVGMLVLFMRAARKKETSVVEAQPPAVSGLIKEAASFVGKQGGTHAKKVSRTAGVFLLRNFFKVTERLFRKGKEYYIRLLHFIEGKREIQRNGSHSAYLEDITVHKKERRENMNTQEVENFH